MSKPPERRGRKKNSKKNGKGFLAIGIGASAGGIKALEQFFEHMPEDHGMAFVVVLHLSPEHESNLPALLQRKTTMPVLQVTKALKVEPQHVYVIPPAKNLVMSDGYIRLSEPEKQRGKRLSIDIFFRTLAEAYNHQSVGIVLSGTGTDGTLGLRRIKEEGGISIAQDPNEAEYDGMPRSAIDTGLVDFVLPIAEMPERLFAIRDTSEKIQIPPEGDKPPRGVEADALREVLALMRARTGHDFSTYKRSTVLRRIARRLQVSNLDEIAEYLKFMRNHPSEVQDLMRELLINVTNFFRDTDAFAALQTEVIPDLFASRSLEEQIRVWVTGCATGEEAYSIAILLAEHAARLDQKPAVQIFATDLDDESIMEAREGIYPETISVDVSADRLKRFFIKEGTHYRVKKEIREMVLFAPHNILRDPPFSKLDLVSCRNLLIYLNRQTQDQVLELFHFALRPSGYLFLGTSESADAVPELFVPIDKKNRIFRRRAVSSVKPPVPSMPLAGRWDIQLPENVTPPRKGFTYSELHRDLLEPYAPASVLINEEYDILHSSGQAEKYLRFVGGEPSRNLLKVVHPDLRLDIRAALFSAMQDGSENQARRVVVKIDDQPEILNITIRPIESPTSEKGLLLVIITQDELTPNVAESGKMQEGREQTDSIEPVVRQMEEQLQRTKDQLRNTIEQYETQTEELKASNEELQAINEELRSATEELETSKEELQSLNEELQTVNHELKDKVDEISRINSDLQNLLAATDIGTIFLDRELKIKRYTPRAQEFFNIIPTDIGRPLGHLTHKLDYSGLAEDAERVLETLMRVEREVQSVGDQWYLARLFPYRTLEDKIDGVVLTFIDITERKKTEGRLRRSEESLRVLFDSVRDYAIFTSDKEGRITSWNSGAEEIFGYTESEIRGQSVAILFTAEDREAGAPAKEMTEAQSKGRAEDERWHIRKGGLRFFASGVIAPLKDNDITGYVKILRDPTRQKTEEEERARLLEQLSEQQNRLEDRVRERTEDLELSNKRLGEEVSERRTAEEQIQRLLRRIVGVQEIERRRISRELHDHLGQQLTALRLALESLKERYRAEADPREDIERLQQMVVRLDRDLDFLAWELRPALLEEIGIVSALDNYIKEWVKNFSIDAEFHATGFEGERLTPDIESNLYRIAQEALNNVYKHADASRVELILEYRNQEVVLIVEDNGKGFDPEILQSVVPKGMGIVSMRERAALIDGSMEIESTPDKGTTVFVRVPAHLVGESDHEPDH